MCDVLKMIVKEALRIEEDTEYSSKGHYYASERWMGYHLWIGLPSALVAALSSGAAFQKETVIAGFLAMLSTALITVLTFLKPSEKSQNHKAVAGQYNALRNQTRIFREIDLLDADDLVALKSRLMELASLRDELNQTSPKIHTRDYNKAKREIEAGNAIYKIDKVEGE